MSERPNKRRRVGHHPFIDVEALVGQNETDSESDSDGGMECRSHRGAEIDSMVPDLGLNDSEEFIDAPSTHRSLAQAMEDAQQSGAWDSFIQRAARRGRRASYGANGEEDDLTDRAPKDGDFLFEIGCKVR